MVNDSQSCIRPRLTMVNHGHLEPYGPWNDHHLTMVTVLLTDHGQYIGFDYHWPSYDHDYWPWSTMVMTIVPFYKHGRPWSDHGQLMVISWSTMVMTMIDHGQTMVDHGLTMILLQGIFSEKSQPRLAMICWWFYNDLFFWLVKQAFRSNREVYLSPVESRNSIISIFISAFALKAVH